MRILIIGGTGFTGPFIVRGLVDLGHTVAVFHRGSTTADLPEGVNHIFGDRAHLEDHAEDLTRFAPQVVVDMIPVTEHHAQVVMGLFSGVAQRVVGISSADVYRAYGRLIQIEPGPLEPVPLTEDSPVRGVLFPYREGLEPDHRLYHYEKILVEQAYLSAPELPGTIIRYPMVYGPGDFQNRLFPHLKRMDDQRPAILLAESMAGWRWTKGYAENMAHAVVLAVTNKQAAGRVYNVGEREALSEAGWVRAIGRAAGWDGKIVTLPGDRTPKEFAPGMRTEQHLVVDSTRIREELGYTEQVPRDEALRRAVAWEREHPPKEINPDSFNYESEDAILAEWGGDEG